LFKDQDKDQTPKDKDKDKDQTSKDKDQDKDCILFLKESLRTRTVASEAICKWGAQCRREAPAEFFLNVPPHFSLVPPPPHEGAQRLFVTD